MIFEREKHRSAAPYMCPSRVTDKPGTRPDWESNLQPFGVWDDAPNHWATRPGLWQTFTAHLLCARPWGYGQSKTDKMTFKRSRPDAGRMQKRPLPTVGCLPELSRAALGDQRLCCIPPVGVYTRINHLTECMQAVCLQSGYFSAGMLTCSRKSRDEDQ